MCSAIYICLSYAKIIYEIEDKVILRQIIEFSNVEILEENLEKFKEYVIINNEYTNYNKIFISNY